jgi:alpha-L-rhamnosidase
MNSFNHYAYGAIGAWLYTTVAGIDSHPAHPGHQRLRLAPRPGGRLSAAWGRYDAGFGTIVSDWRLRDDTFEWLVTVPANCQATAVIPWGDVTLAEGGVAIEQAAGVHGVVRYADRVELALLAGTYHITAQLTA